MKIVYALVAVISLGMMHVSFATSAPPVTEESDQESNYCAGHENAQECQQD
jgi:hypothetical protein